MAGIANIGAVNMRGILARSNGAIMAITALAVDLKVIHCRWRHWYPRCGASSMTALANVTAINVRCALARRHCAVVTTAAGANHLGMIDFLRGHRFPGIRGMADFAEISGIDMSDCLTADTHAIVTGDTCLASHTMVER